MNFYERDVSEELQEYLEEIVQVNKNSKIVDKYVKEFLSALYSSPWALEFMIKQRIFTVENDVFLDIDELNDFSLLNTPRKEDQRRANLLLYIKPFEEELDKLKYILKINKNWINGTNKEFHSIDILYDDPELIKGKFLKMLDYITESFEEEKLVIFTSWKQTAEKIEELLKLKFGQGSCVSFHSGKTDEELQYSADRFQSDDNCKFIVCDELGGEGRNFQIADAIIHFDIPWSPIILEQRIGRLDRVGRDINRDVTSIVIYSEGTVEESLFKIWKESLNVFNESLSGLELVFEEIQNKILDALKNDIRYGLNDIFEEINIYSGQMQEYVEEEQYIDMARHLDIDKENKINEILERFSEENGNKLKEVMNKWGNLIGFKPSKVDTDIYEFLPQNFYQNAFKNTLFTIPDMEKSRKRSNNRYGIRGTFSRSKSIEREDLIFFAPGDVFFDSIINNSMEVSRGRCCAFSKSSNIKWRGVILKWSVDINIQNILEKDKNALKYIKNDYMPMEHIYTIHPFDGYDNIEKSEILNEYFESLNLNPKTLVHIGKRNGKNVRLVDDNSKNNISWFKHNYPRILWRETIVDIYKQGCAEVRKKLKSMNIREIAKKDFENQINSLKSVNKYYEYNKEENIENIKDNVKYYNLILSSLDNPKIGIDSAIVMFLDGEKNE